MLSNLLIRERERDDDACSIGKMFKGVCVEEELVGRERAKMSDKRKREGERDEWRVVG